MQSLFMISKNGEVLIEKHWRKVASRTFVDLFLEQVNRAMEPCDVPPVMSTANLYMINVYRYKLFLLCLVSEEVAPLLVIEFLHRVLDTLHQYFGQVDDVGIKENFSTVYQLLEEMCDHGFPMITELNSLKEMIAPPSLSGRIVASISGKSGIAEELPDGTVSSTPWRRKGVHYNVNSIYFDIIEEIDCIIGSNGEIVSCEVNGELTCTSKLSGMPDMLVSFENPWVISDFSLHPCIRMNRFEKERVLSFVPPDGSFSLMRYQVDPERYSGAGGSTTLGFGAGGDFSKPRNSSIYGGQNRNFANLPIPVYCRPQITYSAVDGHVEVVVGLKTMPRPQFSGSAGTAEGISVIIPFPKTIRSTDLKTNHGVVVCDEQTKICKWKIGRLPKDGTPPKLSGTFTFLPDTPRPEDILTVLLEFKVPDVSVSGLKITDITLLSEAYTPYKYVRSTLRAGKVQIRL